MSDYMVGKAGGKDRYMVGWNKGKEAAYKVGGGQKSGGSSAKGLPDDQDPIVGSKSAFSHAAKDTKDDGSASENMGFGGAVSMGASADPALEYGEKGNWSDSKNAMAKRKARMDAYRQASDPGEKYDSPTVDLVSIKK